MYHGFLVVHSWLRWATLAVAIGATLSALRTVAPGATGTPGRWWDTLLMLTVDLQMAAGLFLYLGLSPTTKVAMNNVGAAMRNPSLRYWAIEHAGGMLAALILVRVGRVLALNAATPAAAQKRRFICFALATVLMLVVIPWPGLQNGRPLFRW